MYGRKESYVQSRKVLYVRQNWGHLVHTVRHTPSAITPSRANKIVQRFMYKKLAQGAALTTVCT